MSINPTALPTTSPLASSASPTSVGNSVPFSAPSNLNPSIANSSFAGLKHLPKEVEAKGGGGRGGSRGGGRKTPGGGDDENNGIIECQNANVTTCTNDSPATLSFKSKLLVGAGIAAGLAIQVLAV